MKRLAPPIKNTPKSLCRLAGESICSSYTWPEEAVSDLRRKTKLPSSFLKQIIPNESEFITKLFAKVLNYLCPPEENPNAHARLVRRFAHYSLLCYFISDCQDGTACYLDTLKIKEGFESRKKKAKTLEIQLSGDPQIILDLLLADLETIYEDCECFELQEEARCEDEYYCICLQSEIQSWSRSHRKLGALWVNQFREAIPFPTPYATP
jgi:hypothetical protein